MESVDVKKAYVFRLTEDDEKLYKFLESIPNRQKSIMIRKMLNFSIKHMDALHNFEVDKDVVMLERTLELVSLNNDLIKSIKEELKDIKSSGFIQQDNVEKEDEIEESTKNTLNNMFQSFGMDF